MAETRTAEMQEPRRESALGRVEALIEVSGVSGDHGCWFEAPQSLQLVNLRGDPDDRIYCDRVRDQLHVSLPVSPNTVSRQGETTLCWLGPDWWLVIKPMSGGSIEDGLRRALTGLHASVCDLTGGHEVLRIGGRAARDVLASACTLDLHPTRFPDGCCVQTQLAHTGVVIIPTIQDPEGQVFDIVVRRSFAEYLLSWLTDAAGEDGYTFRRSV
ncbi:MAG: sarcosine oxidase subunit gamma [Pseudomonadota bacterium]|nr:MAG: sarcosine oxidase subunit gamma [Pseudomonadota bacterium]